MVGSRDVRRAVAQEALAISRLRRRFQELVDTHYDGLWSYVSRLTGGAAEAEDLVHEAFLLAFDRLADGVEFSGDPGKWLRGTARNLVYAWWREKRKLQPQVADRLKLLAEEADDALTAIVREELQAALAHCLGELRTEDRQLVAKRYEESLHVTQIAEQLRKNVATVRVRLFRIRQALKMCIEGQLARGDTSP